MNNLKTFGKYLVTPQQPSPLAITVNLVMVGALITVNGYEIVRDIKKKHEKDLAK